MCVCLGIVNKFGGKAATKEDIHMVWPVGVQRQLPTTAYVATYRERPIPQHSQIDF